MEIEKYLHRKDIYGKNLTFYMKQYGFNIESSASNDKIEVWKKYENLKVYLFYFVGCIFFRGITNFEIPAFLMKEKYEREDIVDI